MQYTRGEPKDFNGLGGKKSLAAEWDRWIADREGGGSMRTARELSQRRRGLRHFGANGLIRSRGRRRGAKSSAVPLRELQLRPEKHPLGLRESGEHMPAQRAISQSESWPSATGRSRPAALLRSPTDGRR